MSDKAPSLLRFVSGVALVLCGLILACVAGEGLVRIATVDQKNYLIEMWRYATLLKRASADPAVGHEHIPGKSVRLQGVDVSINSLGMRGPEPDLPAPDKQRIMIIGDSIAMGWGVAEENTLRSQLANRLGPKAVVMTSGVGNMNLSQTIAHGLHYSAIVRPQTVILLTTARAPELQQPDKAGWLVRHSELYALLVSFVEMTVHNTSGKQGLVDAYKASWTGGPGRDAMEAALDRLQADQKRYGYRIIVMMVPEPHSFSPYLFDFMTKAMKAEAEKRDWAFIDPVPAMKTAPAKRYWVAADDVHPNAIAFRIFTDLLLPYLHAAQK